MLTRRALFGGTFDPVHLGHLSAATEVREALAFDDFRFLPAGTPPHRERTGATATERMRLLELALEDQPGFRIDERELRRDGPSYMRDTLMSLRKEYPDDSLALVLGQDALNGLDRWHCWEEIPDLAHLVVMTRPGESPNYGGALASVLSPRWVSDPAVLGEQPAGAVISVAVTPRAISSTAIRASVQDPVALRRLVPERVAEAIERDGLYAAADL